MEKAAGSNERAGVVVHLRKKKERARRKKDRQGEQDSDEDVNIVPFFMCKFTLIFDSAGRICTHTYKNGRRVRGRSLR